MLIDDFMYQGDLIGELNKDASVIMFTLSKMFAPVVRVYKGPGDDASTL